MQHKQTLCQSKLQRKQTNLHTQRKLNRALAAGIFGFSICPASPVPPVGVGGGSWCPLAPPPLGGPRALPCLLCFSAREAFLHGADSVPYLERSVGVLGSILNVPPAENPSLLAVLLVCHLSLHVCVVVVDDDGRYIAKWVQCLRCFRHPPVRLNVDEVGDVQVAAWKLLLGLVDTETSELVPK